MRTNIKKQGLKNFEEDVNKENNKNLLKEKEISKIEDPAIKNAKLEALSGTSSATEKRGSRTDNSSKTASQEDSDARA